MSNLAIAAIILGSILTYVMIVGTIVAGWEIDSDFEFVLAVLWPLSMVLIPVAMLFAGVYRAPEHIIATISGIRARHRANRIMPKAQVRK